MQENVGRADRIVRSIIGPALMLFGYGPLGARKGRGMGLLTVIGGALLVESAITRVCPVNALLGLDTRTEQERRRDREAAEHAEVAQEEGGDSRGGTVWH
jgi:hypothetical protein